MRDKDEFLIEWRNGLFAYNGKVVLQDVNLHIPIGAFLLIQGDNGSGKTTLLKVLLGILPPTKGELLVCGEPEKNPARRLSLAYLSQQVRAFNPQFPASVEEVVATGLMQKKGRMWKNSCREEKEAVRQVLARVGMEAFMNRKLGDLSGGQQQRVFLARALIEKPEVLFLDEPTVGLDKKTRQEFYATLRLFHREGLTIVLVSHDSDLVVSHESDLVGPVNSGANCLLEVSDHRLHQLTGKPCVFGGESPKEMHVKDGRFPEEPFMVGGGSARTLHMTGGLSSGESRMTDSLSLGEPRLNGSLSPGMRDVFPSSAAPERPKFHLIASRCGKMANKKRKRGGEERV